MKDEFEARMLRIHFGERDKWRERPLCEAIVGKCEELGIAAVIAYRGIEGYGASTRIHRGKSWPFSGDAPLMVSVIDTEEAIGRLLPALDEMVVDGLIAISRVQVIRYSRSSGGSAAAAG